MKNPFIACCGLNCETCDARMATVNNDDSLREKTAQLWGQMNNTSDITPASINCTGCRVEGVKFAYCSTGCPIRQCVIQKNYATCGECPEVAQCKIVGAVLENAPEAKKNLLS